MWGFSAVVMNMQSLPCRKCPRCKEILDPGDFHKRCSECKSCRIERRRKYRKTVEFKKWRKEYVARPEVVEKERARWNLRKQKPLTVLQKLRRSMSDVKWKAKKYDREGKTGPAKYQWEKYERMLKLIERIGGGE